MRKVFWEDPYQQTLTTKVASVEGNEVSFEDTISFSFSGGQESDNATVNGLPILDSRIQDLLIYYTLPEAHNLSVGQEVTMQIEWPRRYKLMRLHFAAELVLEIVTQRFQFEKIGAHIAETKARIDFICDKNISTLFEAILTEYEGIIRSNRPIQTGFTDVATQNRYWKIDGFAEVPCGGTHVKSTGEVGFIILKRCNIGGSKERIEIRLVDDSVS
jgi:Ser-tRNA(Ala) deacylase AlaX